MNELGGQLVVSAGTVKRQEFAFLARGAALAAVAD